MTEMPNSIATMFDLYVQERVNLAIKVEVN